jgi:hypothetical protein
MKSREEQLTWAKQRALICVDMGHFSDAVAFLRADLDENPLTKGAMSSDQAMRGYKAAMDAALGRGSQALTEWIEGLRYPPSIARPTPVRRSRRQRAPANDGRLKTQATTGSQRHFSLVKSLLWAQSHPR